MITVYYHPEHRANVARILTAAADSLRVFETSFGPYPQSQLRIAEAPAYRQFGGLAMPGLVFLSESRAFLIDARDPSRIDLVTRRTAHEVSHQWWGHSRHARRRPRRKHDHRIATALFGAARSRQSGDVRRSLGSSSIATSAAAPPTGIPSAADARHRSGLPLLRQRRHRLNALKHLLGEETLNRALRNFIAAQGGPGHRPVIEDLLRDPSKPTPLHHRA